MSKSNPNGNVVFSGQQRSKAGQVPAGTVYIDMHSGEPRITTARMGAAAMVAQGVRLPARRAG